MNPTHVRICEVGLRDGFQSEDRIAPTDFKVDLIDQLVRAGLREIQIASFVHPRWVPQMADAEAVCERAVRHEGVTFTGLALNDRGLERALAAGLMAVDLSISTSDKHSQENANMSRDEALAQLLSMIDRCLAGGVEARAGLQCVFGCGGGEPTSIDLVVELAGLIAEAGAESVSLADSTGVANPVTIRQVVSAVKNRIGDTPIVLHLHNTRGLGLANVAAALECGVTRFDTSIGGMGGCPFIDGATGNISTEDTVYLLESMGVQTGIDLARVASVTDEAERFFEKQFPGAIHRLVLNRGAEAI